MPLIRRGPLVATDEGATVPNLGAVGPDERRTAARSMGTDSAAAGALGAALALEQDGRAREAILTALLQIGGEPAVEALLPHLRSDDAALRTGVLDILQDLPEVQDHLLALLGDPDPDIRVLAAEIARTATSPDAVDLLCGALRTEEDPSACAAAVDVLAEVGGPSCLPALLVCAERFRSEPFLSFAIRTAIARIGAA
jgi:HEAT repeat protein